MGVPLSPCIGAEKVFNFVSCLSLMQAVAKSNKIRKAFLKFFFCETMGEKRGRARQWWNVGLDFVNQIAREEHK